MLHNFKKLETMDKVPKRRLCQLTSLLLCSLLDCLTLEPGTDRLFWNISAELPLSTV